MKYWFIILFIPFLSAEVCFGQTSFPDSIPIRNTHASGRLKGTRLFLALPTEYNLRYRANSLQEFQKDSTSGFQILENVNENFYRLKDEFLRNRTASENGDIGTSKAVKVGRFDGVYYTGPFKTPERRCVFLIFGDSSFAVTVVGVFQPTDKVSEFELNAILKSISYDNSIIPDPLELVNFKFDLSITGFKYVPYVGMSSLTYSTDGIIKSIEDERHKSTFELETYQSTTIVSAEKIVKLKMEELTEFGISKVSNIYHRSTNINGNPAFETTMDEHGEYVADTKFYIVVIQKKNQVLLFWGVDRDNGKWIEKFKLTVQSINFE